MNLEDTTLALISALAKRVEAQDKTIADALAEGVKLEHRIKGLEADIAFIHRELNAHLHAPQMHGGPGGPKHEVRNGVALFASTEG